MTQDEIRAWCRTWDAERAITHYTTIPRRRSHSLAIIRALDNTPCQDCGKPVGSEARGSRQCLACLKKEIDTMIIRTSCTCYLCLFGKAHACMGGTADGRWRP